MTKSNGNSGGQTGPKTARGKTNSSRNAQKHGLLSRHLIIAGEDRGEFDLLLATLQDELRPVGLLENSLAERIAVTLWRQRRLVRAESASITLRAEEKNGSVVLDFRNYVVDGVSISGLQAALAADNEDQGIVELLEEFATFDPTQANAFQIFQQQCPSAYEVLHKNSVGAGQSVENHLRIKHASLTGFLRWWRSHLLSMLKMKQTVAVFRDARALPESPEILVRYQSGLDNELYKAMRALREAQTWRLSTLDQVAASETA